MNRASMCLLCTAVEVAYRNEKSGGKQEKIVTKEKKKRERGCIFPFLGNENARIFQLQLKF